MKLIIYCCISKLYSINYKIQVDEKIYLWFKLKIIGTTNLILIKLFIIGTDIIKVFMTNSNIKYFSLLDNFTIMQLFQYFNNIKIITNKQ